MCKMNGNDYTMTDVGCWMDGNRAKTISLLVDGLIRLVRTNTGIHSCCFPTSEALVAFLRKLALITDDIVVVVV